MIPLYSNYIKAGFPSPATDYIESELDFNKLLIKNRAATFALRVKGDSMKNAGIYPGDILITDRSLTPKSGDVIIASLDNEFTVKRFIKRDKRYFLYPENPEYPIIEITNRADFSLWGVVTYTLHKTLESNSDSTY